MYLIRSLLLLSAMVLPAAALEIVAHRGASFDAPENTVASIKLGFEQGAEAGECDVYLTIDGKLMVMHDRDTWRTTGVSNLISRSLSSDLRNLEAGRWGEWRGKGFSEKIPFLSEVLAVVPPGKKIFLHLGSGLEMLPTLKTEIQASGLSPAQVVIIAFNYRLVTAAKVLMPEYSALLLYSVGKENPAAETMITNALAAKLDGLDLYFEFPIDTQFVDKVHAAGLKLYTWTVDEPSVARREADAGVDGITTNRPRWLREQLGAARKRE